MKALSQIDLNVSPIEKVEARFNLKRKVGPIHIVLAVYLILFGIAYYTSDWFLLHVNMPDFLPHLPNLSNIVTYSGVAIIFLYLFIEKKIPPIAGMIMHLGTIILYLFYIEWCLFLELRLLIEQNNTDFIINIIYISIIILPFHFIVYAMVQFWYSMYFVDFDVLIEMENQKDTKYTLIGITKKGDYIVCIPSKIKLSQTNEMMIIRSRMSTVTVLDVKEPVEPYIMVPFIKRQLTMKP